MVFVADVIPYELQRIVEFLNEQLDPAECLAVEIRQFVSGETKTLVPRVFGQTSEAQQRKGTRESKVWGPDSFLQAVEDHRGTEQRAAAQQILEYCADRDLSIKWGTGFKFGSFNPKLVFGSKTHNMFSAWTDGTIQIQFSSMNTAPFDEIAQRKTLADRFHAIPGLDVRRDNEYLNTKWASIRLGSLVGEETMSGFFGVWDWYITEVQGASPENVTKNL